MSLRRPMSMKTVQLQSALQRLWLLLKNPLPATSSTGLLLYFLVQFFNRLRCHRRQFAALRALHKIARWMQE